MPSFKCKDIGMKDNFEIKDDNKDELLKMVAMHAENTHGIKEVPPDLMEKIQKAIKK
jgi:predicted small metal-binding protein